jgi:hypothetical protein
MKTPSPQPSPRAGEGVRVAKVNALREWWSSSASVVLTRIETRSASGEELRRRRTLMPSILEKAFKGEL